MTGKFDIPEIRLPRKGDSLFVKSGDWWMNASLDWSHDPTELYIVGYKEAGDALVEAVANRRGTADSLVFPIVFLYRQYLELRLKSLLQDGRRLLDREKRDDIGHHLSKLWPEVKQILEEVWPNQEDDHLEALESLIVQFEEVDPTSTSFRYPKDREGNKSVDIQRVNLRNLCEVIEGISTILDGAAAGISEYQSYKGNMY